MRAKMSKPPPPAPTASAIGPCPTVIKIVGRPGTGSLPSIIAPPDHPQPEDDGNTVKDSLPKRLLNCPYYHPLRTRLCCHRPHLHLQYWSYQIILLLQTGHDLK